jgi:predicted flap endonuclease-1-like 5' DNA nuclease
MTDPESQTGSVLIEYADGRQYEVTTAALADQHHPDAEIVRYFDGRRFVRSRDASIQAAQAGNEAATWRIDGLSDAAIASLVNAGLITHDALSAVSDDDLLALDDIGPASVGRIRAYVQQAKAE